MDDWKLGAVEGRFADLVWAQEPLTSGALVKLCERELGWKKSTTYTVLKKLCDRGLFQNNSGTVTSQVSKDEFRAAQSQQFVSETFDGSLPAFVAAFSSRQALSDAELEELRRMIDSLRKE